MEDSLDPENIADLRQAFGAFIRGITVTTAMSGEKPVGFTANSFSSVSLTPPLLSICIGKTSSNSELFTNTEHFAINILSESKEDLAGIFAKRGIDRFAGVAREKGEHGAPLLQTSAAWFECRKANVIEAGDHYVLIGEVVGYNFSNVNGLGYSKEAYVTAQAEQRAVFAASTGSDTQSAIIGSRGDQVLLTRCNNGRYRLPHLGGIRNLVPAQFE